MSGIIGTGTIKVSLWGMALILLAGTPVGCTGMGDAKALTLRIVAEGFSSPLYLTAPPGDPRLFVVEQRGRIWIVENGQRRPTPFLDIGSRISSGGERGLLSVAFHPHYASNGLFYVDYTDLSGNTRIVRYSVSADPYLADPSSAKQILEINQPYANHNGGLVVFGLDGMLYIGMGDGGSGGDPQGNGQNRATLLGDLLRIDVDNGDPYSIPSDNPFVGMTGMRGEIWAWGLRNPWRFSFNAESGLLYIADVGQNAWEEIDVVDARSAGLNYGWNIMEGSHCYASASCSSAGLVLPALEYGHSEGCSVAGGYVYRGKKIPSLTGMYLYSDYCQGWIRSFTYENGKAVMLREWNTADIGRVLSFGQDSQGELYALSDNGRVYGIVAAE